MKIITLHDVFFNVVTTVMSFRLGKASKQVKKIVKFYALILAFLYATPPVSANDNQPLQTPIAKVQQGTTEGFRVTDGVDAFFGLPYAAPPVGESRWRSPQSAVNWNSTFEASEFGPNCMQTLQPQGRPPWTHEYVVNGTISEDCLTLNIWAPTQPSEKKPVLVWIHGGGFNEGSGSVPIYDGAALAKKGIVVVTINYRLGLFGFLALAEISAEAMGNVPTNFGLQDQIAALRWINENIEAFGGDPAKVTIAGQSAGSVAVHSLVSSPFAKGLFVRAIAQSGLPGLMPMRDLAAAEKVGAQFMRDKGATNLRQLRSLSAEELMANTEGGIGGRYGFGPVVDGTLLPISPTESLKRGTFIDVPMLVGQTSDEGSAFPGYTAEEPEAFQQLMSRSFGEQVDKFSPIYIAQTEDDRIRMSRELRGDRGLAMIFGWFSERINNTRSPVYAYYFRHIEPGVNADKYRAFHSSEIPYVFSTLNTAPERMYTAVDRYVSATMSNYWVNFIISGDPNGRDLPLWPKLQLSAPLLLDIGEEIQSRPFLSPNKLKVYQAYMEQGGVLSMF